MDVEDERLMTSRSWRWLQLRIMRLLDDPNTRLWRHFYGDGG